MASPPFWQLVAFAIVAAGDGSPGAGPNFEREIVPLLTRRCLECHTGSDGPGKLALSTAEGLKTVVKPGKPEESLLIQRIEAGEMPPKKQGQFQKLPAAEVSLLRQWVAAGAPWSAGRIVDPYEITTEVRAGRNWWSFRPIRQPGIPPIAAGANPIDAFVGVRFREHGWDWAPEADQRTLIRRLAFDLIGLPPPYEEVEAFAADTRADAYDRLVERLLASPHYAERWARHWLDVARYAETSGYERDQVKPHVWKYRDWVIRAFQEDMPFDRFVTEQLAGDEVPSRDEQTVVATGFLRLGTWNDEPNDPNEYTYERLEDLVHATSTAFLGLTVKCARCHDHKFDPIRQTDYYRIGAAFWAGPVGPGPANLLGGPDQAALGFDVLGWTDRSPKPPPLKLLKKGDPNRPGATVEPGNLSVIAALDRPLAPAPAGAKTTTRRLQLARWIVDPANPLPARVWVNRVWQHHFGHGLVRSPDNFGFTGEKPTHPELLDWLADDFRAGGMTTKRLHRLMVLSRTYRQASLHPRAAEYARSDAGNRLWWHAERRRRDAESLRDALLLVAGRLDSSRIGGPSFAPEINPEALEGLSMKGNAWHPSPPDQQNRRSLYIFTKRGLLAPQLTTFDFGDTTLPCGQRDVTTVAPQALALFNNAFTHRQSQALARRIAQQASTPAEGVRTAWKLILGRLPKTAEEAAGLAHLRVMARRFTGAGAEAKALASLCHVLLNTNEFMYVD